MMNSSSAPPRPQTGARREPRIPWRLVYVVTIVTATVAIFLLLPNGTSLALIVLFSGLMILHHMPGAGHQGNHSALGSLDGGQQTKR